MATPVIGYPPIEPYDTGMLDVGDGQLVYYEQCGNPDGTPLVLVHGGPGGGWSVNSRRLADPAAYRIVLYDQRGCGRSTPHAAEHDTSLATNTTSYLIADLERLRGHLGLERWLVFGASWGTTLGLAYAEQHPERVTGLILAAVALTRRSDVDWLYGGLRRFLPEEWARYRDAVPAGLRDGDLTQVYDELLNSPDPDVRQHAADAWMAWEDAVISLDAGTTGPSVKRADPRYRLAFARLCAHYFSHGAWLAENQLIEQAHRVHGIPGLLVHGRFDPQGRWRRPGSWPGPGRTPSWWWWRMPGTPRRRSGRPSWPPPTGSDPGRPSAAAAPGKLRPVREWTGRNSPGGGSPQQPLKAEAST